MSRKAYRACQVQMMLICSGLKSTFSGSSFICVVNSFVSWKIFYYRSLFYVSALGISRLHWGNSLTTLMLRRVLK